MDIAANMSDPRTGLYDFGHNPELGNLGFKIGDSPRSRLETYKRQVPCWVLRAREDSIQKSSASRMP